MSKRYAHSADVDAVIIEALEGGGGACAEDYDIAAIRAEAYAWRVDKDSDGNELLNTKGLARVVTEKAFWEIVARHDLTGGDAE